MNKIDESVKILNQGGIIIFPTDTAFGIGCRIDNPKAIERLFKIRKRPVSQATPVLISSIEMALEYLQDIPSEVKEKLIDIYWPGALTIVLNCKKDKVNQLVRGGGETIGIRMPGNKIILEILEKLGVPILGPSANYHGEKTPYKLEDLSASLISQVDFVLDENAGGLETSTVVDCTSNPWKILRKGAIEINI